MRIEIARKIDQNTKTTRIRWAHFLENQRILKRPARPILLEKKTIPNPNGRKVSEVKYHTRREAMTNLLTLNRKETIPRKKTQRAMVMNNPTRKKRK